MAWIQMRITALELLVPDVQAIAEIGAGPTATVPTKVRAANEPGSHVMAFGKEKAGDNGKEMLEDNWGTSRGCP